MDEREIFFLLCRTMAMPVEHPSTWVEMATQSSADELHTNTNTILWTLVLADRQIVLVERSIDVVALDTFHNAANPSTGRHETVR
jgi:hypothetical protein